MTYNGIGVSTPRGTGSSGYVTRALGTLTHQRATFEERRALQQSRPLGDSSAGRIVDASVVEHERKRAVEVRLTDWADEQGIYDKPMDEMEREMILAKQRAIFAAELDAKMRTGAAQLSASLTAANDKLRADARLQDALHVPAGFVPGASFSKDYQEQQKTQRREHWQQAQDRFKQQNEQQQQQQQQKQQQQQQNNQAWGQPPAAKVPVKSDESKSSSKTSKSSKSSKSKEKSSKKSRRKSPSPSSSSSSSSSSYSSSASDSSRSSSSSSASRGSRNRSRSPVRRRSRSPKRSESKKHKEKSKH